MEGGDVLVTGGSGFIGSAVTRRLVSDLGADVHVADTRPPDRESATASYRAVDVRSAEFVEAATACDPDAIVHLAALSDLAYCRDHPDEAFDVNVMGTENVLAAARECSPDAVAIASSGAVYAPDTDLLSESSRLGPTDVYGETKLVGERLAEAFAARTGISTPVARPFTVYGPDREAPNLFSAITDQLEGGGREVTLGNLSPRRDYVHVDDVARAFVSLLASFDGGYRAFNVATGSSHSVREVVRQVSRTLDREIEIAQDETRMRGTERPELRGDPSRLRAETAWRPRYDLRDGIRDVLEAEGLL